MRRARRRGGRARHRPSELGTGITLGTHSDKYLYARAFRTLASPIAGGYTPEALPSSGALSIAWFRDRLSGLGEHDLSREATARANGGFSGAKSGRKWCAIRHIRPPAAIKRVGLLKGAQENCAGMRLDDRMKVTSPATKLCSVSTHGHVQSNSRCQNHSAGGAPLPAANRNRRRRMRT